MRIISFSQKWDKLKNPEFTTFRYPRVDTDWYVGETVQVYFKNRSSMREKLGIAQIVQKERRELDLDFSLRGNIPLVPESEAIADGFPGGRKEMVTYMEKQYRLDYISHMNKLTLRWLLPPQQERKVS